MQNEVIDQIHRLAIAAEKYEGIVFTDMDGNIHSDQFMESLDSMTIQQKALEILITQEANNAFQNEKEEQLTLDMDEEEGSTTSYP